ncbi:hypothetical protein ACFMQL_20185 [Nonomuraea fastidiosa]|uniref:hypothetical protein n=1 Tax=Nonomuraea fastidiosa TaxID=46173 RepID=UPI0036702647
MPVKRPDPRQPASVAPAAETQPEPVRRRLREAQWVNLHVTTARLDPGTNNRLTAANEATGQNPQQIWEEAINFLATQNGIQEEMPPNAELRMPIPSEYRPAGQDWVKSAVRLTTNTRARLVATASRLNLSGSETVELALNTYFDEIGIPGSYDPQRMYARPKVYMTSARLDEATRARVKAAAKKTGTSARGVWEAAINAYADRHRVPAKMPEGAELTLPTPSNHPSKGDLKPVQTRLEENTRARLVALCLRQSRTGSEVIADALNAYFDQLGISRPDDQTV